MPPTTGQLRRLLSRRLNHEELRNLCQDLHVDYDDLPGEGKTAKIRELLDHLERRDRLGDVITCLQSRPDLQRELQIVGQPPSTPVGRAIATLAQHPRRVFIILAVALVGSIAVLLTFPSLYPSPPATPTPTFTPTATKSPSPTSTPSATLTPSLTPTPTIPPLPTPTPTPEPFDQSYLGILVADFVCGATQKEFCLEGADLAQAAHDDLVRRIERENMSRRVAVRRVGPVLDDDQAKTIGEQHGARLVVWGYVPSDAQSDQRTFVPSFTLMESDERLITVDPVLFGVRISGFETLELSQQLSARVTGVSTFILAMVYLTEGQSDDYEQAVRMLDLSIEGALQECDQIDANDPRRADLEYTLSIFYATRGIAYAALGNEKSAYDNYQIALEYDSDSIRAQCGLGNYHFVRGELDAAYEAFEQARRLDPTLYRPHYGLAIVAFMQGDYQEAETRLKRAIELASTQNIDPITAYFTLGLTYLQLGDWEQAVIEFQHVLSNEKVPPDLQGTAESLLTPQPTLTPFPPMTVIVPTQESVYPAPTLEHIDIVGRNVTLRWSWSRDLADDEWFSVRLGIGAPQRSIAWTKQQEHICPLDNAGMYSWEIAVCRGDPAAGICEQLTVSEQNTFVFVGGIQTERPPTGIPPTAMPPTNTRPPTIIPPTIIPPTGTPTPTPIGP